MTSPSSCAKMQRTLTLNDREMAAAGEADSFCLVCNAGLDVASCAHIFYTSLPKNGELLASFILRVLRPAASDLRGSYVCLRCYNLFQMLEQAQWTVANIRCEIHKVYHSRDREKGNEIFLNDVQEQKIITVGGRYDEMEDFREINEETIANVAALDSSIQNRAIDNDFNNTSIEINASVENLIDTKSEIENCHEDLQRNNRYNKINNSVVIVKQMERSNGENVTVRENIATLDSLHKDCTIHHDFNAMNTENTSVDDINIIDTKSGIESSLVDFEESNKYSKLHDVNNVEKQMEKHKKEKMKVARENIVSDDTLVTNCMINNNFSNLNIEINANEDDLMIINTKIDLETSLVDLERNNQYNNKIDHSDKNAKQAEQSNDKENLISRQITRENHGNDSQNLITSVSKEFFKSSESSRMDKSRESGTMSKKNLYTKQCRICTRSFKSSKDLESHTLKHGGSHPYHCQKCDDRFENLSLANDHALKIHSSNKNCILIATEPIDNEIIDFSNEDCILSKSEDDVDGNTEESEKNTEFERSSWKSGRISKYSQKPLKYPCSTCGKKWRTATELKTHVKSHSNLRPFMCEKCGQAYKHKHALEIHIGMHNGVSPFQCSVCKKCFTQKGALMRHLPMHTGEMPFQCELCGKRFVHHTSYNMHALSHTGKKSYQCDVCDLSLLSTSHLKRHMRVHTGEKPYSCTLCNKSFAERYNLFAHQKIHDPVEIMARAAKKMTYKCEQCDAIFDKKNKLDDHGKKHRKNLADGGPNRRKWMDRTEIEALRLMETSKTNDGLIVQSWQDINYPKLQNIEVGLKSARTDNCMSQISSESLTMLMATANYNKGLEVIIQNSNSAKITEIDRMQN